MSSEVQIAVIDQQDTQIVLAVPGVQGATGSNLPTGGTANQVLRKASSTNYDTNWSLVTNAMVDSSAAIAGTKISPNFGSQNVVTTGTSTAASFIPTSSSVPTNGVYLPSANNVAISTNGTGRLFVDASGNVGVGAAATARFSATTSSASVLDIYRTATGEARLTFFNNNASSAATIAARVAGLLTDATAGAEGGALIFSTTNAGASNERLRITSDGKLGLGTNNPGALLDLAASNDGATGTTANNTLRFTDTDANTAADQPIGKIEWYSADTSSPGARAVSYIMSSAAGANSGGDIRFGISANAGTVTEAARITSDGKLLVGTPSARANFFNTTDTALAQVEGTNTTDFAVIRNVDSTAGPNLILGKTRGSTVGSNTLVGNSDTLGSISFQGADGTQFVEGAHIRAVTDGTVGADDLPTRLVFSTTADGASSPTERMRIDSSGRLGLGTSSPSTRLSVVGSATGLANGAIRTNTTGGTQSANSGLWLCGNQATTHYNWLIASQFNVSGALEITPSTAVDGATFTTPTAVFTQTGRVGIGTTPVVDLDVAPAASTATFRIHARSNTTPVASIELVRGTNTTFGADASGDYRIKNDTGNLSFEYGDSGVTTERARIDSSGRLLVGTSSARAIEPFGIFTGGTNGSHVIEGVASAGVGIACVANSDTNASIGPHILLGRTRGNASAANIIVQAGDNLGTIGFAGADGTDIRTKAAAIYAEVDGTPGVDDMPGRLVFSTTADGAASPTARATIDSSGRLLVNTSSTSADTLFRVQGKQSSSASNGVIQIARGQTNPASDNGLGWVDFTDAAGSVGASIRAETELNWGASDYPSRLVFSTTADGASSPTEALRITNDRVIAYNQPDVTSKSAAATLTIAELKTSIIQYTGAAATLTLPTGTLSEGGFSGIYTNMTFEWSVINTGSGTCTIGAGTGHTIVGGATVAAGASGRFASRRTAANTFVTYRLS